MKARRDTVAETRARIVDATVALHQRVGPRLSTISAIAKEAGVERLTVYRHFPDEDSVFAACSHRFTELNPPPNPEAWATLPDPTGRTSHGLGELYDYFSRTEEMFHKIYRDADDYPSLKKIMNGFNGYLRGLADVLTAGWPDQSGNPLLSALMRHAVKFSTWRALTDDGLPNTEKVGLILKCASAFADRGKTKA